LNSCARAAKVGVVEFLNGVGKGVETHAAKLEEAVGGDLQRLLETRTLRLKKLGVPVKHVRVLPLPDNPSDLLLVVVSYKALCACWL
jgi:hypothetical protein